MEYYEPRDLKAFSAEPLLIYPTHYTGQPGYLSDTETSTIWDNETVATDWDRTLSRKSRQQGQIHTDAQNKDALPPQPSLDASSSARDELWLLTWLRDPNNSRTCLMFQFFWPRTSRELTVLFWLADRSLWLDASCAFCGGDAEPEWVKLADFWEVVSTVAISLAYKIRIMKTSVELLGGLNRTVNLMLP